MKSADIRQAFIQFFESKGHTFVPPNSIAPENDPTLLFTNAGMNQFKDVFLGEGTRPYTRAVNSQVCIRVSGKHNDLEDVGKDTTHQTSFEMLGNWSFGDFYKKEAITWAWELFTRVYGIDKTKLYATVFETDDESEALWKSETDINPDHVLRCGKKDNFWEMGETGPCGPCSELHVDLGPQYCDKPDTPHICQVNGECNRYVEFWNLVFIQHNRLPDGSLQDLPAKHVDTGAGLERISAYLQGVHSNYLTDLFTPIIHKIVQLSGVPYQDNIQGMPHRVMADHVRTLVFGIADNVMPSNDGRGYVLRRLLRRALRYAKKLNLETAVLHQLVPDVVQVMGAYLPHLKERESFIITVIQAEEEQFLRTLDEGLKRFEQSVSELKTKELPGQEAFQLYDTFGFPVDLTQVLAEEKGITVDMAGFEKALSVQKERSRASTKEKLHQEQSHEKVVIDPKKFEGLDLHLSEYTDRARGGEARLIADPQEKVEMARHHTATHVLHEALRQELGAHVQQAGSLVDTHRLRFDFTHFAALTSDQLQRIEDEVNAKINAAIPVTIHFMTLDEAKQKGAMALFGEKYDADRVRVVQMETYSTELCGGTHVANTRMIEAFKIINESAIAAGTRRIEALAGQALVADYEYHQKQDLITQIKQKQTQAHDIACTLAQSPKAPYVADPSLSLDVIKGNLQEWMTYLKDLEKEQEKAKSHQASALGETLLHAIKNDAVVSLVPGADLKTLQLLSDQLIAQHPALKVVLGSTDQDKGFFLVKLGPQVDTTAYNAQAVIQNLTAVAGGKGGGNAQKAQAGGADPQKVQEALQGISF